MIQNFQKLNKVFMSKRNADSIELLSDSDDEGRDAHTRTAVLARVLRTPRAGYKEYGVRRAPCLRSTDFTTRYEGFFQARGTKGTEYEKYQFLGARNLTRGTTIFFKHGVRKVRSTKSTVLQEYEKFVKIQKTINYIYII